jgi:formylglycine-generating enzyme required for sulfatase activity
MFFRLIFLTLLCFSAQAADNPNLVLLPIDVTEQDSELEAEYGAALQEGLQNRYTVFYGASVEKELEKEYSKVDCDAETCNQNIAIAFNGELIADGAVKRIDGGYLLKLVVSNVLTSEVIETRTEPCENCNQFAVINFLKKIGRGEKIDNSGTRSSSNGRTQVHIIESEAPTVSIKNAGKRAILIFDTQPSGAKIKINGKDKGVTPYQGLDHKVGDNIKILIDQQYYQSYELDLELQQAITQVDTVILKKGTGRLFIASTQYIPNSQVFVNGEAKGLAPQFIDVASGEYNVQIKSNSQSSILSTAKVTIGEQLNLTLPPVGSAQSGTVKDDLAVLILNTQPEGVSVTFEGEKLGITPLQILNKTMGDSLILTLSKKYYRSVTANIDLNETINRVGNIELTRAKGTVLITTTPFVTGGKIFIDEKLYGNIPLNVELLAGEYEVQVKAPRQSTNKQRLEVNVGDNAPVSLGFGIQAGAVETINVEGASFEFIGIPAGSFQMGSNENANETPVHAVNVPAFKMMTTEVTKGQFAAFIKDSGYKTDAERNYAQADGCNTWKEEGWKYEWRTGTSWRQPDFKQGDKHPVVCVSHNDAMKFIAWLNQQTGQTYNLPSEAQWEYAAKAGSSGKYPWGSYTSKQCQYANGTDNTSSSGGRGWGWGEKAECNDGYWFTASVASYKPNAFGLYDMHGNVWEWTQDCWNESYKGAPSDGSPWLKGGCNRVVVRGGSWNNIPTFLRSAVRDRNGRANRYNSYGFRLIQGQ